MSVYLPWILIGAAYLFGAIPVGYLVGRAKGVDVTQVGSGNIGATNVGRSLGTGLGLAVGVADLLKGLIPVVWAAALLKANAVPWPYVAGVACAAPLGHCFSPFLKFRGGRAVSTSLGVLLALDWRVALGALAVWVLVVSVSRYVSLGSILGAISAPVLLALLPARPGMEGAHQPYLYAGIALAALILARHAANLGRLVRGTESKVGGATRHDYETVADAPESETEYR